MALAKARKELVKELSWMRGQVEKIEAVLGLIDGTARKKFKMSAATRRKISIGRRKQLASKK